MIDTRLIVAVLEWIAKFCSRMAELIDDSLRAALILDIQRELLIAPAENAAGLHRALELIARA